MKHARQDYQGRIVDLANLIPPGEPVFFIRGQDRAAPVALRAWADEAERIGASVDIVGLVRRHAEEMEQWQREQTAKVPDLPS